MSAAKPDTSGRVGEIEARLAKATPGSLRTCTVYRTEALHLKPKHEQHNYNAGDQPQFEACIFSDGRVAQRWLTVSRSMVWWDSWEDLCAVHISAHPDYGTRVEWHSSLSANAGLRQALEEARDVLDKVRPWFTAIERAKAEGPIVAEGKALLARIDSALSKEGTP